MKIYSPNIVVKRCQQAGLSFWTASKAGLELKDRIHSKMSDDDINLQITKVLRGIDGDAAARFESYHSIRVRTSKNVLESFDRFRITNSLVKETRVPRGVAEEIAQEVEDDIRRLQLTNISTPLIREMVNTTLIQKRLGGAKAKYTRVGLPVYDIREIVEKESLSHPYELNMLFGNRMLAEYALTRVLPQKISHAYLNSDIYVHSLEQFITCPISFQNDLRLFLKHGFALEGVVRTGPAKKAEVAISHAARILTTSRNYVSRGVGFDFFNIFMAPYIRRKTNKEIEQVCQTFFYELNRNYASKHSYVINLDLQIPNFLKNEKAIGMGGKEVGVYGDYEDEARRFLKIFLETMRKGDHTKRAFMWPEVCLKTYKKSDFDLFDPKDIDFVINQTDKNRCLLYEEVVSSRNHIGLRTGTIQRISLNLPKFARLSIDEKSFYSNVEKYLDLAKDVALIKRDILRKRLYKSRSLSFLAQFFEENEYIKLNDSSYVISILGLPQACQIFLNRDEYDKSCLNMSERIVRFALRKFREYKKDEDLNFFLGETKEKEVIERFKNQNLSLGIDMEIDSSVIPESYEEKEKAYQNLQPLFEGGAFFKTDKENMKKSKDLLFLSLKR